jgi:hypothetical protein
MTETPIPRFRTGALSHRKPTRFRLAPGAAERAALAASLDLIDLPRLSFEGEIAPQGRDDFALTGRLVAEAVQACVVTLAPVPARIDEPCGAATWLTMPSPRAKRSKCPRTTAPSRCPRRSTWPKCCARRWRWPCRPIRAPPGAELGEAVFAGPGTAPIRDADLKPFAALAKLRGDTDPGRNWGLRPSGIRLCSAPHSSCEAAAVGYCPTRS